MSANIANFWHKYSRVDLQHIKETFTWLPTKPGFTYCKYCNLSCKASNGL